MTDGSFVRSVRVVAGAARSVRCDTFRRLVPAVFATCVALTPLAGGAAAWADPAKTLRVAFEVDVTGFDPAGVQDVYSNAIIARIFDALYVWDYLARPYKLVPSAAAAMPEIS